MMSMAWLTFLVGMAALWGAAARAPMGGFLLDCLLGVAGAAAVLGVVAFAPGVRRMEVPHRMPLLGVIACPVPAALAVWSWFNVGLRTVRCRPGTPPDDT
ncbi:hypothetical protein CTU88_42135 [Streptomyces sp. JV178]|nr:hypothetical protein CTU88_42135 [Streptomyces sp. JV178]